MSAAATAAAEAVDAMTNGKESLPTRVSLRDTELLTGQKDLLISHPGIDTILLSLTPLIPCPAAEPARKRRGREKRTSKSLLQA